MKAVYPGTFDPITNGHIDIINRALKIFDGIDILVSYNYSKKPLFSLEERIDMIENVVKDDRVQINIYKGLLIDYIRDKNIKVVIRGLRAVSDFEYEFQMALTNRKMYKNFEILFFMTDINYTYLNSSIVKEIAKLNGNIKEMVPEYVVKKLMEKTKNV